MLGWLLQIVGFVLMVPVFRKAKRWTPFWLYATSVATGFVLFFIGGFFQPDEVIIRQHWAMMSGIGILLVLVMVLVYFRREKRREAVELEETVTEEV